MSSTLQDSHDTAEVILILAPSVNDGTVASEVLVNAGMKSVVCSDVEHLCSCIEKGCGTVIVSEDALTELAIKQLQEILDKQEPWSELPIILLTSNDIVHATEIFSRSGNIFLLERPFSSLTFIRSAEVALRARRKQYEVRTLLSQLKNSRDDAERASVAKSQFLANMSHEIRTPIGAIMGFINLLKDPGNLAEEKLSFMSVIERNSQHLLHLIDDILDISKVEAGKMTIERLDFKLTDLLADFSSVMGFKAAEKGILFKITLDTLIPEEICTDPVRLRQILSNIVGNAIKFTDRGSVDLRVSFDNGILKFLVKDTGVGLSEVQASRLFQPFSQADASTNRKFGGTGLGLVLSRRLSEALGGSLKLVNSTEGLGSTFVIEIHPTITNKYLVGQDALGIESVVASQDYKSNALGGVKILVVEDSPDNQILISKYLRDTGAEVSLVSDGAQGMKTALEKDFDIILMDIQMPYMDGHQATRELRKLKYKKPIIALTAHAMNEEREKCLASGFTEYLTKPIQPVKLVEVLSHYVKLQ